MNTQFAASGKRMSPEALSRFGSFVTLVHAMCVANHVQLSEQRITVVSPGVEVEMEFLGQQPLGFAFTEGHHATFNVPFGHRFVLEQVNLSCWAESSHLRVQLATKSPRGFRNVTLYCPPESSEPGLSCELSADAPIVVNGSSRNTFLFSDEEVANSPVVPPQTYVQVWGYLEPTSRKLAS